MPTKCQTTVYVEFLNNFYVPNSHLAPFQSLQPIIWLV